ncbi:MAG: hypothetical protein II131_00285, partial [Neisseriaceae bacterium]|nr:hypothetical protein [Neisseriaceae bacterium]
FVVRRLHTPCIGTARHDSIFCMGFSGCLKDFLTNLFKNFPKPLASFFVYLYNRRLSPEWGVILILSGIGTSWL